MGRGTRVIYIGAGLDPDARGITELFLENCESYGFRGLEGERFIKIATGLDPDARGITYF